MSQTFSIKDSISKRWDCSSEAYDSHHGHGIKSAEERQAWEALLGGVLPEGALAILDVGCGTGEISLLLAGMGYAVTGIDLSEKMLGRARAKAEALGLPVVFQSGDAEDPPFAEGSFDAVINRHVLWTLPNPLKAVRSWKRVLRPGGKAIIIDGIWNDGSPGTRVRRFVSDAMILIVDRKNPWKNRYSDDISLLLPNAGGTPPGRAKGYLDDTGFRSVNLIDLKHIIELQKSRMPFRNRIAYKYRYYLISGEK